MLKTILVVDDDPDILNLTRIILEMKGYHVVTLNNGVDLLTAVKAIKPALMLLDVQLGELDGRHLCQEIKQAEESSKTIVILFSANNQFHIDIEQYLCDKFLEKPFNVNELIEMIAFHTKHL